MPLIVDGYNLLRALQKADEQFERLEEAALCRILSEYLERIRDHGHIYFDGIGPPDKSQLAGLTGLEVYFSGPDLEADDLILDKIQDNTAPRRLVVVSSDREIRDAAARRKAAAMPCEAFWMELVKTLERPTIVADPPEKRQGISDLETDQWLDVFGLD